MFEEKLLPADSPFWAMANVIISPYVAGFTPHYHEQVLGIFAQNLQRLLNGETLLNVADRNSGYEVLGVRDEKTSSTPNHSRE